MKKKNKKKKKNILLPTVARYRALSAVLLFRMCHITSGPEVIELFSCSTQLNMKYALLINLKLLTSANSFLLNTAEHENFSANKYENANHCWHFHIY